MGKRIHNRQFISKVATWLTLIVSLTGILSIHRFIRITFALKDSNKCLVKTIHRTATVNDPCCCTECSTPRLSEILNSALFRFGISRGGGGSSNNRLSSDGDDVMIRHPRILSTHTTSRRRSTISTDDSSRPQLLLSTHHCGRRRTACSFYIWNAPSALLHRWCHHLQRDNIYEGLGGKKFVRIQPGSMLQLLYPCSQYSVDRCLLCGGTFRDHLTLWWSKHLYTPYDRYLDQVYHDSLKKSPTLSARNDPMTRRGKSSFISEDDNTVEFEYHSQYVLDITSLFENLQRPRDKAKVLKQTIQQRYYHSQSTTVPHVNINAMEQRTWPRYSNQSNKRKYLIPRRNAILVDSNFRQDKSQSKSSTTTRKPTTGQSLILWLARDLCLDAIDRLLDLQSQQLGTKVEP